MDDRAALADPLREERTFVVATDAMRPGGGRVPKRTTTHGKPRHARRVLLEGRGAVGECSDALKAVDRRAPQVRVIAVDAMSK
jgi:hypothetical protein